MVRNTSIFLQRSYPSEDITVTLIHISLTSHIDTTVAEFGTVGNVEVLLSASIDCSVNGELLILYDTEHKVMTNLYPQNLLIVLKRFLGISTFLTC